MPSLVLASASPRRQQFLRELGFAFTVRPPELDERPLSGEAPLAYVRRIADEKAGRVAASTRHDDVVLAADTLVTVDGLILGKPADEADFQRMMGLLAGRTHQVVTAVCVRSADRIDSTHVSTDVTFRALGREEIAWYWRSGEPHDKAGGYALQGLGGAFVARIEGSHSGVIGLPLVETLTLLAGAGLRPPWGGAA